MAANSNWLTHSLTIAPGERVAPPPVRLTDGPVGGPLEGHSLLAAEGHDGVQGRPRPLQPPVGQDPRRAAVDLCNDKNGGKRSL